jgi:hypothetical protein
MTLFQKHEKEGTTHLSEAEKVRRNEIKREEMKVLMELQYH